MNKIYGMVFMLLMSFSVHAREGRVIHVEALHSSHVPVQHCYEEVDHYRYERHRRNDEINYGGAIIGGLIGSQIGDGRGRDAAIAAGAVIGSRYNRHGYYERSRPVTRTRCETIYQRNVEYRVEYEYRGRIYTTYTDYPPGRWIRHW